MSRKTTEKALRNHKVYTLHQQGMRIVDLAKRYKCSPQNILRILQQEQLKRSNRDMRVQQAQGASRG